MSNKNLPVLKDPMDPYGEFAMTKAELEEARANDTNPDANKAREISKTKNISGFKVG